MSILNEFSFAVVVTDPRQKDNPIIFASPTFLELTGYSATEVLGRNCRFLQGPDTERRQIMEIRDALREERSCKVCLVNYKKSGEKFWNQLYIEPVFSHENQVCRYVGIQTDITRLVQQQISSSSEGHSIDVDEVVKAERVNAMRVSRRISESGEARVNEKETVSVLPSSILGSLERIQQSFVLVDPHLPDMPIVHAGEAFVKLTGYPRNEIIGRNCRFLQGPQTDAHEVDRIKKAVTSDPPQSITCTLLNYKYDGTPFWNALHISPVRGSDGKVAYLVGVQLDANEDRGHVELPEDVKILQSGVEEAIPICGKIGLKHKILQNGTVGEVRVAIRSLSGSDRGLRRSLSNCRLPESDTTQQQD